MAQLAVMAVMAVGQLYKGKQQQKLKEREAQAYLDAADRRQAAMTQEVAEDQRAKELMYSRALLIAGAQTGNTSDAGIQTLLADLNAEGDYRILSTIWIGQTEAEGLRFRAEAARREGDAAKTASRISAVTSALTAYVGMGGPDAALFGSFGQKAKMERGLQAATVSREAIGEVWDEAKKQWVKKGSSKTALGGLRLPSYGFAI